MCYFSKKILLKTCIVVTLLIGLRKNGHKIKIITITIMRVAQDLKYILCNNNKKNKNQYTVNYPAFFSYTFLYVGHRKVG